MSIKALSLICVFAPFVGSVFCGFFRKILGKIGAHSVTILGLVISFVAAVGVSVVLSQNSDAVYNFILYTVVSGGNWFPYQFNIGFLIDPLSAVMMITVTFVSLLVHIYSIGYMSDDDGYQQ